MLYKDALENLSGRFDFFYLYNKSAFQKWDNNKYYCLIVINLNSIVNIKESRVYFYIDSKKFEFEFVRYYV